MFKKGPMNVRGLILRNMVVAKNQAMAGPTYCTGY